MNELLTVTEVARRFRVEPHTVTRWIKSGALKAVSLPSTGKRQSYRVKAANVERLIHGDNNEDQE